MSAELQGLADRIVDRAPTAAPASARWVERARGFYELGKPNLSALVVVTAVIGFVLASSGPIDWVLLLHVTVGTWFSAFGACGLNMVLEHEVDAKMTRTRQRPIPSGRVTVGQGLLLSSAAVVLGVAQLGLFIGALPALISLLTTAIYVLLYTPLKRRHGPLSVVVGAIPGAMPTLIGWSSVHHGLGLGGWLLFAVLFLWQFPHFLALAFLYQRDYAKAGFHFLPSTEEPAQTGLLIAAGCVVVTVASVLLFTAGFAGWLYGVGAIVAGVLFSAMGLRVAAECSPTRARAAFIASVTYLPLLFIFIVIDRLIIA
ncbi:MAG: protoheme IX farnesyltransferase [Deltaproteobacteria bacterium]|nr:protoheme IX farnesyltransferase [Deltaproteobacteria bacterium]